MQQEKRRSLHQERRLRSNAEQEAARLREQLSVLVKEAGAGSVLLAAGQLAMGPCLTQEALKASEKQEARYPKNSLAAEALQWKRLAAHRGKLWEQEKVQAGKITQAEYAGSEARQGFHSNQRTRAAMVREAQGSFRLGGFDS
ncbi:Hypothetical protein SCF082_LOCUS14187 [Durusdinium trenchii]|uniref:Flagellar FliJ protein n=1 Tax=Durusdinium trenchii TaxID=1381693 RepID=A0ABP0JXC3_9DINO